MSDLMRAAKRPARFVFFMLLILLSGCVGTRYLDEGEYLLYDQEIKGANKVSEDELSEFYRQQPNRRLPLISFAPYVWVYQIGLRNYDQEELQQEKEAVAEKYDQKIEEVQGRERRVRRLTEKKDKKISKIERSIEEGNLLMRWGEPLAIYDSSVAASTEAQMQSYLHTKGFFNGRADHSTRLNGKRVTSIYTITENQPYIIDSLVYTTEDSTIRRLIRENLKQREVQEGKVYDQAELSAERDRIDELLKNNGYFNFSKQYIQYRVDSTLGDHRVLVNLIVNQPASLARHKQYYLDSVVFTTDADIRSPNTERQTDTYNGITYRYYNYEYYKKILDRRVFIRPDSLYNRRETLQTQQQLSNLDVFRFININYDTADGKFIARIFASPLKKYQTANEVGLNVSQGYPGPFINSSVKVRNIFGGLEILELSGRAGIEGVPAATNIETRNLRSIEIGANLGLTFPQFLFPLPNALQDNLGLLNPRTIVQTGYNYINRPEYIRTNFKNTLSYNWQKQQKYLYNFTPVDINFINSNIKDPDFEELLLEQQARGIPLIESFKPSFVTSTSFTSIFNFNNYGSYGVETEERRSATFLKMFVESGGTLFNFISTNFLDSLQHFKFLKFNPDFRQYIPLSRLSTFAYRLNIGVAVPYGDNKALPYEKYYFAGGSNSIRAWRPRRLGPGGAKPGNGQEVDEDGYFIYNIEQPGEILLEASVEFRRNLFGFVNGAFFIDAGNIWRIIEVQDIPEATFKFNEFYRQIAIGSGLGVRLDFSFLILRFDFGFKVYDPARDEGNRWIGQQFPVGQELSRAVLNIGIGYPF